MCFFLSDTYQRIQQQSDIEWKYGLAKLIRNMQKTQVNKIQEIFILGNDFPKLYFFEC